MVQAVLYEVLAVLFVGPVLAYFFEEPLASSALLAVLLSGIAMTWNFVFNAGFEWWEARQPSRERTWRRRMIHGLGFEGGLALWLVPVMAWWLNIGWWDALVADLGLLVFFLGYAVVFTWCFDRVFGLPESARAPEAT